MSRRSGFQGLVLSTALTAAACSGGSAAKMDAASVTPDASESDASTVGDGAVSVDASTPRTDAGDANTTAETVPAGDHFCLHKAASDAIAWQRGWDSKCAVTIASPPPFTAALKSAADYWCTFYDAAATTPAACPPREDLLGFCEGFPNPGAGLKSWTLIYKSKVLPDTDALSLNPAAAGCVVMPLRDPAGQIIPARKCTGTVTAKVDGVMKDFSSKVYCTYKSDGTKSVYFVEADTSATDRLQLYIQKEGTAVTFVTDDPLTAISKGAGYLEGGSNAFVTPADAAARTVAATTFADKGAGLVSTFSLGDYKNGTNVVRTITEGMISIKIEP